MKNLFIAGVVLVCFSCHQKEEPHYFISEIEDTTDAHFLHADATTVLSLCDFQGDPSKAVTLRKRYVTDRRLSPIEVITLESKSAGSFLNTGDYVYFREGEIASFNNKVKKLYARQEQRINAAIEPKNSECLHAIGEELSYLATVTGERKICLIYSNMFENASFSFYKKGIVDVSDTAYVRQALREAYPLPETLLGIEIYLLYKPIDRSDDITYMFVATEYKSLLESKNATVTIQASNNF